MIAMKRTVFISLVLALLAAGQAFPQSIYWTETNYPAPKGGEAEPDGSNPQSTALTPETLPEGVALDLLNDKLYWVESGFMDARVLRAEKDFTGITEIVTGGSVFRGIALDSPSDHMYWTSSNLIAGSKIHRADLDGSNEMVMIDFGPGNFNPRGIALDMTNGKMYWADFDQNQIRRADLAGTNVENLVTLAAGAGPWGVELDTDNDKLIWTEYNTGRVMQSDLEGAGSSQLVGGLDNPTYITLDTDGTHLFWVEAGVGAQKIQSADANGSNVHDLGIAIQTYGGITFDPSVTTQTRLLLFVANTVEEGIELQWQFGEQNPFESMWVERSEIDYESWHRLETEIRRDGGRFITLDGGALPGRSYRYRLVARSGNDEPATFGPVIGVAGGTITEFALAPIHPNPTMGNTRIEFSVPRQSRVTLRVINVQGRAVASLMNEVKQPGHYHMVWDGRTRNGVAAPGTYFVLLRTPEIELVQQVTVVR
jgi:hypothetical protein